MIRFNLILLGVFHIIEYFVENAILDVTSPVTITEAMLSGKTFYSADINDTGYGWYVFMTHSSHGGITRHEIGYNTADGPVASDITLDLPYALVDGKVRFDLTSVGGGCMWATLVLETEDQWNRILKWMG